MSNMAKRLLTAGILSPIGLFIIITQIFNGLLFFFILLVLQVILILEIAQMAEKKGYNYHLWLTSTLITLNLINFYLYGFGIFTLSIFIMVAFIFILFYSLILFLAESTRKKYHASFEVIGLSFFTYISIGWLLGLLGLIKMMDMSGWLVIILLAITWLSDAGGLFIGKALGKTRLEFLSSPNKTLEGYIGCILFGQLTGVILYFLQNALGMITIFSLWQYLLLALLISLSSIIGDLIESTMKRWAGVKDSGTIIPGHGGLYDMMDSVITTTPVFFVILKIIGY